MTTRWHSWLRRGWPEWSIVLHRRLVPGARRTASLPGGLRLTVRLTDELAPSYLLGRSFEPETVELLTTFLEPGDVVLDVGANIGHMSIVAAARVGPTGKVFAFEPAPGEFAELQKNISLNDLPNVEALPLAVSEKAGSVPFYLAGKGLGLYNSIGRPFRAVNAQRIEVPATNIDAFVAERGIQEVSLVKMDVEGGEIAAIRGGRGLFSQSNAPLFVCEFSDVASISTGQTSEQLWRLFEEMGYTLHEFVPQTQPLTLRVAARRPHYDYQNLVAVKPRHTDRLRKCGLV